MEYSDHSSHFRMDLTEEIRVPEQFSMHLVLFYVLDGEMKLTLQNELFTLQANDVILINPNESFSYWSVPDFLLFRMQIPVEVIGERIYCNSTRGSQSGYEELRRILKRLLEEYVTADEDTNTLRILSLYYALLDQLKAHFADSGQRELSGSFRKMDRMLQIETYIHSGYKRDISLGDLARKLNLSVAYLSRYFKKNFGSNFETILTGLRLQHVAEDLVNTDHTVSRISVENGFSNNNLMNRAFQAAYHMTPSAYRKEYRSYPGDAEKEKRLKEKAVSLLYHEKRNASKEEMLPSREIVIDTSKMVPYCKNWDQVVNIGDTEMLLQADVQKQILRLTDEIGFSWVRIGNLFSETMLGAIMPDTRSFYFHKIDQALDFLIENNIHPFVNLCRSKTTSRLQEDLTVVNRLTELYLHHALQRYGREEVGKWQIEILDSRQDQTESEEEFHTYLKFFRLEYERIKSIVPEILVGGCGSSNLFHKENLIQTLRQWRKYGPMPDFFSVRLYAYQRRVSNQSEMIRISSDPDYISHALTQIREIMDQEQFDVSRLYVTEWNQTVDPNNYLNDSCYRACYNLRTMFLSLDKADLMIYDTGTDLSEGDRQTNDLLYGGRGLMSRDGFFKPSGITYSFVKHLFPYCIDRTEKYIITTDGNGFYGIIAHNGKMLNNRFYASEENRLQKEKLWQYYEDQKNFDLRLVLDHVESGIYQFQIWQVNEENGSILDQWRFLDFCDISSRGMLRHFRQSVNPGFYYTHRKTEEGRLRIEWRLKANEALLIRIERIREN